MPISLALFDMDDVLVHYDRSARVACLASLSNRSFDEVGNAIWGSGLEAKADAGEIDDVAYLRETSKLLGCDVSRDEWLRARRESMSANLEVLALAAEVSKTCTIAILTNNPQLVADHIDYLCPPVADLFGKNVFASASFKASKPSPGAFLRCIDALGAIPSETLFVDDLEVNVAGARDVGLFGHVFTGSNALSQALREHNLLSR